MPDKIHPRKIGDLIQIETELEWKYAYYDQEQKWLAFCPSLRIALQSEALSDLKQDMIEAVDTLFHELIKSDQLKKFLRERGWSTKNPLPRKSRNTIVDMSVRFKRVEADDLQEAVC